MNKNSSPINSPEVDSLKAASPRHGLKPRNGMPPEELNGRESSVGSPQDFLGNRFVYIVVSPRAGGLSVGVNMNPDKQCNFDCAYCEVDRSTPSNDPILDVDVMARELEETINYVKSNRLFEHPVIGALPREFLQLRHVALSGHGEPTLCPNFVQAVHAIVHLRALGRVPYYKLVLLTNGTGLDSVAVQSGLKYFTPNDEIWVKLDAGTQEFMDVVNRPKVPLEKVLQNILTFGRQRPIVIQSLFASYDDKEPVLEQIEQYAQRLRELKIAGTQISMIQVYSANRPSHNPKCRHLPLKSLSRIAQVLRCATGLRVEVY